MAEVTREVVHDRKGGSSFVSWLALILAVLALVVAWMAYNRSGQDLETRIRQQVNESVNSSRDEVQEGTDAVDDATDNVDETDNTTEPQQ